MSSNIFSFGKGDWISVDRPTSFRSDHAKRAFQCGPRNSLASVVAVDEEACSPPVRRRDVHIAITPHPTRELDKGSELTPSNDIGPIVDEGCVGPVCSNKLLLVFLVLPRPLLMLTRGEVEEGAPAATPDPIMFLDHPLKIGPCK